MKFPKRLLCFKINVDVSKSFVLFSSCNYLKGMKVGRPKVGKWTVLFYAGLVIQKRSAGFYSFNLDVRWWIYTNISYETTARILIWILYNIIFHFKFSIYIAEFQQLRPLAGIEKCQASKEFWNICHWKVLSG